MSVNLLTVIIFSLLGGIVSLVGGVLLLARQSVARRLAGFGTPFAAGALLAAVFVDLLPDSVNECYVGTELTWTLVGILAFFLFEYSFRWFHHHHEHADEHRPLKFMAIVGDTLHNTLDGVAIAVSFLISFPTGVITTFAVAAHEIPQEIGDFGLLLGAGMSRRRVLLFNLLSALATTLAAIITYKLGNERQLPLAAMVGISSGFLLYIALADLIPTIHGNAKRRSFRPAVLMLLGVFVVLAATSLVRRFVGDV